MLAVIGVIYKKFVCNPKIIDINKIILTQCEEDVINAIQLYATFVSPSNCNI